MWVLQLSDPEQCLALPNSGSPRKESELGLSGDGAGEVTRWKDSAACHSWAGLVRLLGGPRASAGAAPASTSDEKLEAQRSAQGPSLSVARAWTAVSPFLNENAGPS